MPETRKPKDRAEILDELLSRGRWTGNQLLEKVNKKLADLDEKTINIRTLKRDLDYLDTKRAPLHRPVKGDMTYYYEEDFSIKNIPLESEEVRALKQAVAILRKVDNFQITKDLDLIVAKLENRIHTNVPDNQTIVQFEDHTFALGSNWYTDLFDAIREQNALSIVYQSYKHPEPKTYLVHPYLLKEFRNRWFLVGREGSSSRLLTLGLDRIKKIRMSDEKYRVNDLFDPETFYENVIGVSMDYDAKIQDIVVKINPVSAQHVESKPIHKKQEILKKEVDGSLIVKLHLIINYELKSILLGFGEGLEVLEPTSLRDEIRTQHEKSLSQYVKGT
jgi:predicted DNA-binding transcriptional regulator YafY